MPHCMTFNICKDNAAAAAEFVKRLKAAGHQAELVTHDEDLAEQLAAHNAKHDNAPPASASYDAPVELALEVATAIEEFGIEPARPSSSSPTGPFRGWRDE